MKIIYTALPFLMIALLFLSCEKQDLPTVSNELTLKNVRREVPSIDIVRKASFTEEGKIRNVILGNISTTEFDDTKREYIYTTDNLLECIPGFSSSDWPGCYPFLEYTNGILTTLNGNILEYNGNTIVEHYLNQDGRTIYEFTNQNYDQLLKAEYIRDVSTNPTVSHQTNFTYDGGNLVFIQRKRINDTTGLLELIHETEYTYDNKRNPYQQGHNQIALVSYFQQMMILQWNEFNLIYRSTNNVVTRSYTNYLSDYQSSFSYSFEYNSNDYPVKRTHVVDGMEFVMKYEYYD